MPRVLKAYKILCFEILFLISLGGAVRAMDAGLACPDWPLCFGDVIPDYHPQVYFEFIHRALAGLVGLSLLGFHGYFLRRKDVPLKVKKVAVLGLFILLAQVVMGGLTVLLQLHAQVVTAHLVLGISLFASCLYILWRLEEDFHPKSRPSLVPSWLPALTLLVLVVICAQILLGGLVASHYAGVVCTDFPLCHGQFIPTLKGIIGLHVIHRLGGYTVLLVALALAVATQVSKDLPAEFKASALRLLSVVCLQVAVGIANVVFYNPALITVTHSFLAASIFALAFRIVFRVGLAHKEAAQPIVFVG